MASGFGWGGGRSRCFSYWQEFQKCYAQTDSPQECIPQSDDYLECLHHFKAIKRDQAVQHELQRRVEQYAQEQQHNTASSTPAVGSVGGSSKKEGIPEEPAK